MCRLRLHGLRQPLVQHPDNATQSFERAGVLWGGLRVGPVHVVTPFLQVG